MFLLFFIDYFNINTMPYYQKHIFLCNNVKEGERKCCSQGCSNDMRLYLKNKLKVLGMLGEGKVRVSASGCMGRCKVGPAMVIYPQGLWYTYHSEQDIDEILKKSILQDSLVERLLI